jgi:hypothetical protein
MNTGRCKGCHMDELSCIELGYCVKDDKVKMVKDEQVLEYMEKNIYNFAPEGQEGDLIPYLATKTAEGLYFAVYTTREEARSLNKMPKGPVKQAILDRLIKKQHEIDAAARLFTDSLGFNYLM